MNFANVKDWVIPEGDVKKVTDSRKRIIWRKDTYTILDRLLVNTNKTGIIVPIHLLGGVSHEIGMDFQYTGTNASSYYKIYDIVNVMGNWNPGNYHNLLGFASQGSSYAPLAHYWISKSNNNGSQIVALSNISDLQKRYQYIVSVPNYDNTSTTTGNNTCKATITLRNDDGSTLGSTTDSYMNMCWTSGSGTSVTFHDVNSYYGFGLWCNENGEVYSNPGKFTGYIYECWVKVGGEYSCHLLPAMRDLTGQYGFYDVINEVFYPSVTENEFDYVITPITSMTLSDAEVPIGSTIKLTPTINPAIANKELSWTSSDPNIATVDSDGVVTGVSYGNVTITVTDEITGVSTTCNVFSYIGIDSISITPSNSSVNVGEAVYLSVVYSPTNATYKNFWWTELSPSTTGKGTISYTVASGSNWSRCRVEGVSVYSGYNTKKPNVLQVTSYDGKKATANVMVTDVVINVDSISLNKTSASIGVGGTEQLILTVSPSNATNQTRSWSTSDSSVATVNSSGLVTGIGDGTATITVSCGGKTATCTVTVTAPEPVTGVSLDITYATLTSGDTITLTPTASPSTAGNVTYTWTSSNTSVATVNSSGKVTAVGNGTATITCTGHGYNNSTASATCSITVATVQKYNLRVVCNNVSSATVTISGYGSGTGSYTASAVVGTVLNYTISAQGYQTITGSETVSTNWDPDLYTVSLGLTPIAVTDVTVEPSNLTLYVGDTYTLTSTVSPSDALNKTLTWSSYNTTIATVNSSGKITAKAAGVVEITATSNNGISSSCHLTVKPKQTYSINPSSVTLNVGGTATITVSASPDSVPALAQSSNTNVATISPSSPVSIPNTFTVTGIAPGVATISFSTYEVSGTIPVTCNVTVQQIAKYLQIINNDDNPIYYHTEDLGDKSLSAESTTPITLTPGDSLYIRTTDSINHTVDLSCNSVYTTSSGYYKITYAKAEDGDSITVFR